MTKAPLVDLRIAQLIDANLDRGREGLRVIEDWCRFGLKEKELVIELKNLRQELGAKHHVNYKRGRSTSSDSGIGLNHPYQQSRANPFEIVSANCARVQEAMRVIEEFTRVFDPELSKIAEKVRYNLYEIELEIIRTSKGKKRRDKLANCKLCLITSPHKDLKRIVNQVLKVGVTMIQYRCKEMSDRDKINDALELADICHKHGSLFIVNDRVDIAIAAKADGVHLGQKDFPTDVARIILGSEMLVGRSTNCIEQIHLAEAEKCDYVGLGPINKSKTKENLKSIGTNCLQEITKTTHIPWFAIGGINISNLRDLIELGTKRIAVSASIMDAKDPGKAAQELLEVIK